MFRRLSDAPRKTQNKRREGKRGTQRMERRGTDERNEREGQKAKKCVRRPRRKHDTAGPDLEALEGDIPDSCRRAWIILGPLLARGPPKNGGPNQNQI